MNFTDFWRTLSRQEKEGLAIKCDTTHGYLVNIAENGKTPSVEMCLLIEAATDFKVNAESLRPDASWKRIFSCFRNRNRALKR